MAKMIPPHFNEATTSTAERYLYYRLQDHLDGDWTVIHSLPWLDDTRPRLREGECDFLLLHPRYGLLVIEVKSGEPRYDGTSDEWSYADGSRLKDPFLQVREGMHYIVRLLVRNSRTWVEAGLPYGYAVAFPDARSVRGGLKPDMHMDLVLLEPDLDQFQNSVIKALRRFGTALPSAASDATAGALEVLRPTFRLTPALGASVEVARRKLVRLTEEQAFAFEGLSGNRRLVVRGGAGTGKTLLAAAEARRLAADGKQVLLLCFNRPLASFLREHLTDLGDSVHAITFHDFCGEVLREANSPTPTEQGREYWDKLVEAAEAALPQTSTRYDAILVDEAQDFRAEWWLLIEEFLACPGASCFHIFIDDHQNLYGRSGQIPFTEPEYRLRRNCRNTGPVARFTCGAIGLDTAYGDELPDGPEPHVHVVADAEAEHKAVRLVLHELVHEHGIEPDRIAILGCHRIENSSLGSRRKLGNLTVRELTEPDAPNTIRYSTVHKFKGLEADCILLIGIGEPSGHYAEEDWRRFLYIGGSRARFYLHVFAREGVNFPGYAGYSNN